MEDENEARKKHASYKIGQVLDELSVEEIVEVVDLLKQEIERLEIAKQSKSAHLSAAEALFKQ